MAPDSLPGNDEELLKGGRANAGQVVRIGNEVARPTYPQTPSVEHFLHHLNASAIDFTPLPRGTDELGRNRLSFLPGQAPMPPYPAWAFDQDLLIAVADHQAKLHHAAESYVPAPEAVWAVSAGNYFPAEAFETANLVVCHNDLGMTNTIVDDRHQFVGFIDFDYCRPIDRLFDIAVAARHWVPFGDLDLDDTGDIDRLARFKLFCDEHKLSAVERARVVTLAVAFLDAARANIQALAAAGRVGFQELLANGYEVTNRATVSWLIDNAEALAGTS